MKIVLDILTKIKTLIDKCICKIGTGFKAGFLTHQTNQNQLKYLYRHFLNCLAILFY